MDKRISVDDILNELQSGASGGNEPYDPKSSMDEVNDMIEQILLEKKNRELKDNHAILSRDEQEQLEKEIKVQTKNLIKQYEKVVKENTRKQKKLERDGAEFAKVLKLDDEELVQSFAALEQELEKQSTIPIKLATVHPEQKVKLEKPLAQITASLPNKDKIDAYKQSAHIDHIKREAMNITSHFGGFKDAQPHQKSDEQDGVININSYRKYKQSRNEKIGSFVLSPANAPDADGAPTTPAAEVTEPKAAESKTAADQKAAGALQPDPIAGVREPKRPRRKAVLFDPDEQHTDIAGFEIDATQSMLITPEEAKLEAMAPTGEMTAPKNIGTEGVDRQKRMADARPITEHDDDEESSYSFSTEEETERLISMIKRKLTFARISTFCLIPLAICAIILMFVKIDTSGLMLFGKTSIPLDTFASANLILLALSCIFSFGVIKRTFASMVTREPTKDTLYFVTMLVTATATVVLWLDPTKLLTPGIHMYAPVLTVTLLFNSLSELIIAGKANRNLEYILAGNPLYTASLVDDDVVCSEMTRGLVDDDVYLAKNVKTTLFTRFIENSFKSNRCDDLTAKMCVFVFPLALLMSAGVYILSKNLYTAVTMFSGFMTVSATLVGGLLVAFPLKDTSRIIEHFAGMSPCSDSIIQLEDVNSVLIDGYDLFPKGTVKLQGIKTFSGKRIDNAILDASSVLCECRSALSHVFLDVIANNKGILKPVDSIVYEDLMGISAWVDNKRVLIGNRELMINHSIAVPKKEYEDKYREINQDIVYIAAEGELCAAFIIGITTKKGIYDAVHLLRRNRIGFALKSVDALFTAEKIAGLFGIEEDCFKILPSRLHNTFIKEHEPKAKNDILVGNNGSLLGFIIALVTTKKLSSCITSGIVINVFSIILGIALLAALYFFDMLKLVTPIMMMAYLAVFGLLYWFQQKNTHV